jgi:cysteine desulfurase
MSNSLAIQGFVFANPNCAFVTSTVEHNDIMLCAEHLKCKCEYITVDKYGMLSLDQLAKLDNKYMGKVVLYSIQMANSETGVIQYMDQISKIVHRYPNHYLHTDATQYIPYHRVDVKQLGIDMLSMSGQKIGCIKGTGLLYVSKDITLTPIIWGEQGLIGGTENVHGISCLGKAFECLSYSISEMKELQKEFMDMILNESILIGSKDNRLPNNILVRFPNINAETMIMLLNENGIYVSGGSACSAKNGKPSHVLLAMGYFEKEANECVRFTLPKDITKEKLDQAIVVINECYEMLRYI